MFEGVECNGLNVDAFIGEPVCHPFGTGLDTQTNHYDACRTKLFCLILCELLCVPIVKIVEPAIYPAGLVI